MSSLRFSQKELAIQILFDENFTGNAYREETDFFIRCTLQGAKVMYDSRAVQVNLPRQVATGERIVEDALNGTYRQLLIIGTFLKRIGRIFKVTINSRIIFIKDN